LAPCSSERVSCCLGSLISTGKNGQASRLLPLVSSWSCPSRLQEVPHRRGICLSFYKYNVVVGTVGMWEGPVLWPLPSVGGKDGTASPFHTFHGRSISTVRLAVTYERRCVCYAESFLLPISRLLFSEPDSASDWPLRVNPAALLSRLRMARQSRRTRGSRPIKSESNL
jgi:hypothetical protein